MEEANGKKTWEQIPSITAKNSKVGLSPAWGGCLNVGLKKELGREERKQRTFGVGGKGSG